MTWLNRLPGPFHTSTKLFNAILQESWQDVLFELEMHPNHASHWEHVGFDGEHETKLFPLHQALKLNAPTEVILKLLEAYPEVLHRKDDYYQRLPLHIAAIAGCPPRGNSDADHGVSLRHGTAGYLWACTVTLRSLSSVFHRYR